MPRHDGDGSHKGRPTPRLRQRGQALQKYGDLRFLPIGLSDEVRKESIELLNQLLADTIVLRELYKKHHWQVAGPTFHQLHELFDAHYDAQAELVDQLAERIQMLGGVGVADLHDVVELAQIERPPRDAEDVPVQLSRLLEAHETILVTVRRAAHAAAENGDAGTNDLLVSELLRTHEMQVWFLAEHLVDMPLTNEETERPIPRATPTRPEGREERRRP